MHPLEEKAKTIDILPNYKKYYDIIGEPTLASCPHRGFQLGAPGTPIDAIRTAEYIDRVYIKADITFWELLGIMEGMKHRFLKYVGSNQRYNAFFKNPGHNQIIIPTYEPTIEYKYEIRLYGELY